jgi:hypothetical protein
MRGAAALVLGWHLAVLAFVVLLMAHAHGR